MLQDVEKNRHLRRAINSNIEKNSDHATEEHITRGLYKARTAICGGR